MLKLDRMITEKRLLALILILAVIGLIGIYNYGYNAKGTIESTTTTAPTTTSTTTITTSTTITTTTTTTTTIPECSLSLCDCKCHIKGTTIEESTGRLCGINCLGIYNVSDCRFENGECREIKVIKIGSTTTTTISRFHGTGYRQLTMETSFFCPKCVQGVVELLKSKEGVISTDIMYRSKYSKVIYDPKKITKEEVMMLIRSSGDGTEIEDVEL